jgi:hypothetical protein
MKDDTRHREKVVYLAEYKKKTPPQQRRKPSPRDQLIDEVAFHLLMAARAIEAGRH